MTLLTTYMYVSLRKIFFYQRFLVKEYFCFYRCYVEGWIFYLIIVASLVLRLKPKYVFLIKQSSEN